MKQTLGTLDKRRLNDVLARVDFEVGLEHPKVEWLGLKGKDASCITDQPREEQTVVAEVRGYIDCTKAGLEQLSYQPGEFRFPHSMCCNLTRNDAVTFGSEQYF